MYYWRHRLTEATGRQHLFNYCYCSLQYVSGV